MICAYALQDIVENEALQLDWVFKRSLIMDIASVGIIDICVVLCVYQE